MLAAARRAASAAAQSARRIHSSPAVNAGGHGHGGYEDYIHAPQMYNITAMKNRKFKFALGVGGVVTLGVGIPLIACQWQFIKARG